MWKYVGGEDSHELVHVLIFDHDISHRLRLNRSLPVAGNSGVAGMTIAAIVAVKDMCKDHVKDLWTQCLHGGLRLSDRN